MPSWDLLPSGYREAGSKHITEAHGVLIVTDPMDRATIGSALPGKLQFMPVVLVLY